MPARNGKREFLLSAIAFALGAVPIFMLLLGDMAAMGSMGMSVSDMINNPPDKAMMTPMVQAIHNFMQGYIPYVLFPATVALLFVWTYASRNYPRLANRIGAGLAAGFIACPKKTFPSVARSLEKGEGLMNIPSDESSKKGFYAAVAGIIAIALCCFTPTLVVLLAAVGLGAFTRHLDYVLFPALAVLVIVALVSYRKSKIHAQS